MSIVTKLVIWSTILVALVAYAAVRAGWNNQNHPNTPDFQYWQEKYKDIAYQLSTDPTVKEATAATPIDVEQYTLQSFAFIQTDGTTQQRVDRCESCHIGVDNPAMTAENIIKTVTGATVTTADVPAYLNAHPNIRDIVYTLGTHPGKGPSVTQGALSWAVVTGKSTDADDAARAASDKNVITKHPFATFGCTTCHYGSGRELTQALAHGHNEYWLQPLLPHKYLDAGCAQCHQTFNPKSFSIGYMPQMTTIARGETLFKQNACWGCHKIEGFSKGNIGPELTYEGRLETYTSVAHQLWDPRYKVNNCVMPYFFSHYRSPQDINGVQQDGYLTNFGNPEPVSSVTPADIGEADIATTLAAHGYVADASKEADVDALVTFVIAQTGLSYGEDTTSRMTRLTTYDETAPLTVPVTAPEGKLIFEQSGCYACHYLGDPNNPKNGHGGGVGPNLSWEGARHSRQWVQAHYVNPQALVPKSIMPIFPFSDSQRAALTLYDLTYLPKGSRPVSPDQDMPSAAAQKNNIVVPQVRYMTR